jgi:hypothetical protein
MTTLAVRITEASAGSSVAMAAAVGAGAFVAVHPAAAAGALVLGAVGALVWARPHVAAYLVIGITPLVAGIDRGTLFPLLRPNEALAVFLAAVLISRGLLRMPASKRFRISLHPVEQAFVAMAVASSVIPVVWMLARGRELTGDDVTYALVLWKFLGVYALVRTTVKTQEHIHRCLQVSVIAAVVVASVGILQVLEVIGLHTWPMSLYVPEGHGGDLGGPRASSTLTLPAATADLLIFNLMIAVGMYFRKGRDYPWYAAAAVLFVVGVFAAGEFSSALGLLIAGVAVAFVLRLPRLLLAMPVVATFGIVAMWPVVEHRLQGFASVHGLPASWLGRIHNLETYFWPELGAGPNMLLGVRPSARVSIDNEITGFVWIESGYTWLLWGGGVPLLLTFVAFAAVTYRLTTTQLRVGPPYTQVAALATLVALIVVVGLMVFDPHLTYRGSADCFFALLALTVVGRRRSDPADLDRDDGDSAPSISALQGRRSDADSR